MIKLQEEISSCSFIQNFINKLNNLKIIYRFLPNKF